MENQPINLSVVIITYNEEKNIERCLLSVQKITNDIVVVDSFSTDKTKEICNKFDSVTFYERAWEGYSETKNFANSIAKNNWILSLDADEALSPELENSILKLLENGIEMAKLNRLTNYCGKWIKHCGWYPDTKIRIFNRESTKWTGTIHEVLSYPNTNTIIHLKGDLLHYSCYTREQHYKQVYHFTDIMAQSRYEMGKKSSYIKLIFSPIVKFIRDYFIKLGFLDGYAGFTISRISAYATFLKYKKLRNLHRSNGQSL